MDSSLDCSGREKDLPPVEIPDHELISLIGEGSYGQVWIARNTIGTYRAVKIVRRDSFQHERPFEREVEGIRKFEPVSRTHPGLVAILHVGQSSDGNCFYYVMELGDNIHSEEDFDPYKYQVKSLATTVWDKGRLPVDRCIELALSLSDALAYLHEQDLIHRDVKPANIIFVAGYPKLADIGLVTEASSANTYVGTEGFIPPEGPNSEQGDIYSLGKTLYEISTGQDRNQFPALPASVIEKGPDDGLLELVEIINQACHHDRAVRYQNARAMHAEITALANGRSIRRLRLLERRMSTFNRIFKIAALVLVPVLVIVYLYQQEREARLRETNREIGALEVDAARDMDAANYASSLRKVSDAWALAPEDEDNVDLQSLRASQILAQMPSLADYWAADSAITSMRFSELGDYLYVGGDKGLVGRYTLGEGDFLRFPGHIKDVRSIDLNEERGFLVSAGADREVKLWSLKSGEGITSFRHPCGLWAVKISPDGNSFVSGGDSEDGENYFYVWDVNSPEKPQLRVPIESSVWGLDFSQDGALLAVASGESSYVFHMDHLNDEKAFVEMPHPKRVFDVCFIDGAKRLVTACQDGSYRVFELGNEGVDYKSPEQQFGLRGIDESPDNRFIATAGWDSTVQIRTRINGELLNPKLYHSGRVNVVQFGPDGHRMAVGASDGTIRVWDLAGRQVAPRLEGYWEISRSGSLARLDEELKEIVWLKGDSEQRYRLQEGVSADGVEIALSRSGMHVLSIESGANGESNIAVWNPQNVDLKPVEILWESSERLEFFDVSAGDRTVLLGSRNGFQLFEFETGKAIWERMELSTNIEDLFFSPSGAELVVQCVEEVRVMRCKDLSEIGEPFRTGFPIAHAEIDPSNTILSVSNSDLGLEERSSFLFKFRSSNLPYAELRHRDGVNLSRFDSSGVQVVTASEDATVKVWSAARGERILDPIKHSLGVSDATFSLDENQILASCAGRTVRIWDSRTGFPVSPPINFPYEVGLVVFGSDGNRIICQTPKGNLTWTWSLARTAPRLELLGEYASVLCGDQLDRGRSREQALSGWRSIKREYPQFVKTSKEDLLVWHRHQMFEATIHVFNLPELFEDEEFEFWEKVEMFHLRRLQELTGQALSDDLAYIELVHGIAKDKRLRARLGE